MKTKKKCCKKYKKKGTACKRCPKFSDCGRSVQDPALVLVQIGVSDELR